MKKTNAIFALILLSSNLSIAFSQEKTPSSSDDQIAKATRLANTISEMKARINSDDSAIRLAAIEVALSNESPTVRGIALAAALSRFDTLTPKIIVEKENPIEPGDLPNISIADIRWSPDMHHLKGHIVLDGLAEVTGEVTDNRLGLTFNRVKIARKLLKKENQTGAPNNSGEVKTCRAHLETNEGRNALEGPMTCDDVNTSFLVRLYFLG